MNVKLDTSGFVITKGEKGEIALDRDALFEEFLTRLTVNPLRQYKCQNCGAGLAIPIDRHIVVCKYCDSVYVIGKAMLNDV